MHPRRAPHGRLGCRRSPGVDACKIESEKGMKTKHTPGPWCAIGHWVEHANDSTPDIANCNPESMGQGGRSDKEVCANARLIAQAPELFRLLQRVFKNQNKLTAGDFEAIRLVIDSATGARHPPLDFDNRRPSTPLGPRDGNL